MGRRPKSLEKEWVPLTPFQEWLDEALEHKGWDLKYLAEAAGVDYSNLWRTARGNPQSYPGRTRLSVEAVTSIGLLLGDVAGALKSSNYPVPQGTVIVDTPGLGDLPEFEREPDEEELQRRLMAYTGDNPVLRAGKRAALGEQRMLEEAQSVAGAIRRAGPALTGDEPEEVIVRGRRKGILKVEK